MQSAVQLVQKINDAIVNPVITLFVAVAIVVFLWGIVQYVVGADDETKRDQGKRAIIYGLIGLFVMVAVKGILLLFLNTFGVDRPPGL